MAVGHRDDQSGAVAVVVALCLLLLFGAGAIALDLGSMWETKRDLVVDTDAAALAGAKALTDGDCGDAREVAEDFLKLNSGDGSIVLVQGVDFDCDEGDGTVKVDYTGQGQQTLSGAIGADNLAVHSSSTALFEVGTGEGLRPMAVCRTDPMVSPFVANPDAGPIGGWVSMQRFDNKDGESSCVGAPGNWGWLCIDGASECNGQGDLNDKVEFGYQGDVTLGTDPDSTSDNSCLDSNDAPECTTEPGNFGSGQPQQDVLDSITCTPDDCKRFPILVIDGYSGTGRTTVVPWGYLYIQVDGWCTQGKNGGSATVADCSGARSKGVHLEVSAHGLQKTGAPGELFGGAENVSLCAHDGGDACPS